MQTRSLPIADLRPAPYNPRLPLKPGSPAWNRLERSLLEFSLVQPIVWNERTGHVVAGHQRVEILKRHGRTHVDVVPVDLPLEREKALNVALNNSQLASDWDADLLLDLLKDLQSLPDFDATLTGFDHSDLHDMLLAPEPDLPPEPQPQESNSVEVSFQVPHGQWPQVRPDLDALLAHHRLKPHIQLPRPPLQSTR